MTVLRTVLRNDHLLVTMLEDFCEHIEVPTLFEALEMDEHYLMFRSTERLSPCPEIYDEKRVVMWEGQEFGEILIEDIEQFSDAKHVKIADETEWQDVMSKLPEKQVKEAIAGILAEPVKKDWGGESDDHFSANTVAGKLQRLPHNQVEHPVNTA